MKERKREFFYETPGIHHVHKYYTFFIYHWWLGPPLVASGNKKNTPITIS